VSKRNKTLILGSVALVVFLAVCLSAWYAGQAQPAGGPPWYGIVPPLLAVTLALVTNRVFLSLTVAVFAGGLLSTLGSSAPSLGSLVQGIYQGWLFALHSLKEPGRFTVTDNVQILVYVVLIMSMISVMLVGGGLQGVANRLMRYARSVRSTKLATMAMGLVIFIDDYSNTMIVGSTMRPMTDRQRISREKLAFLVDATAAPVAGIAVLTTWIGYEVGVLSETAELLKLDKDGFAMFFDALGFQFYSIGMIAFVFFNSLSGVDFGPMAKAERRAAEQGKLLADGAKPMGSQSPASAQAHPKANLHPMVAVLPMATLLAFFVVGLWLDGGGAARMDADPLAFLRVSAWRDVFSAADSILLLACASGIGLVVAVVSARVASPIPLSALAKAVLIGIRGSLLPMTILVLAWSLKGACEELQTGRFLAGVLADFLWPLLFPALVFIVAGLVSFATGTSYGTMGILFPTAIPVAFELDGGTYGLVTVISIAAVLDGSIFGDHCSPISDTTIMSSAASTCDHMGHVRTQIPYSLAVAAIAVCVGYLPAGMGMPRWAGLLGGAMISGLLFLGLWIRMRARNPRRDNLSDFPQS